MSSFGSFVNEGRLLQIQFTKLIHRQAHVCSERIRAASAQRVAGSFGRFVITRLYHIASPSKHSQTSNFASPSFILTKTCSELLPARRVQVHGTQSMRFGITCHSGSHYMHDGLVNTEPKPLNAHRRCFVWWWMLGAIHPPAIQTLRTHACFITCFSNPK